MPDSVSPANRAFTRYRVVDKRVESRVITSVTLAPADGAPLPSYVPGQHLVFRLDAGEGGALRHYSVSGDPARRDVLRISVKREPAPKDRPDLPPGAGSAYMHDRVRIGDTLVAAGPLGDFALDETSERPVLLFSGGVGLTPMMSMLYRLVRASGRRVYFLHACEDGDVHAFADEVAGLAREREGVAVHFCYREPTARDRVQGGFHSAGLITRETLQALLPLDDYDVYLCGPAGFMQANWRLLRGLGIAAQRIHYEFFGPATVLDADESVSPPEPARAGDAPAAAAVSGPGGAARQAMDDAAHEAMDGAAGEPATAQVKFGSTGVALPWDGTCSSLLELAEQAGLDPDFNCRSGLCNTCMSTLVSGAVEYFEEPLDPPPAGKVLLCCSRPVGPVEIELGTEA